MAAGKRPARRHHRRAPQASTHVAAGTQGVTTVGEIARGTEYDAILGLASPKTIRVVDRMYTEEEAEQVTRLRHERWNLLAEWAALPNISALDEKYHLHMKRRFERVQADLYKLTGNPIYYVEG
jgi:hypothetical protein